MQLTRRRFLQSSLALAAAAVAPRFAQAALPDVRSLHFYNTHTGERLKIAYFENGAYNNEALTAINRVLRDHRTGDVHPIATPLLDLLSTLHRRTESQAAFEVISGYRSPKSNAMLHEHTAGVAKGSFHMSGMAIDIRLPDKQLSHVRQCALAMNRGGVGYYPASRFVHVDTGPVRHW